MPLYPLRPFVPRPPFFGPADGALRARAEAGNSPQARTGLREPRSRRSAVRGTAHQTVPRNVRRGNVGVDGRDQAGRRVDGFNSGGPGPVGLGAGGNVPEGDTV